MNNPGVDLIARALAPHAGLLAQITDLQLREAEIKRLLNLNVDKFSFKAIPVGYRLVPPFEVTPHNLNQQLYLNAPAVYEALQRDNLNLYALLSHPKKANYYASLP